MPSEILVQGVGQAGNLLSCKERIKEEVHRKRQVEDDFILRALITAMRFYRWHRFHFTQGKRSIYTERGKDEYGYETVPGLGNGLPRDLLQIDDVQVYQTPLPSIVSSLSAPDPAPPFDPPQVDQAPRYSYPMKPVTVSYMRYMKGYSLSESVPYLYSFDGRAFEIYPTPDGVYEIPVDYLVDLDIPGYQFIGGSWIYLDKNGNPISDAYSTPWLDHAEGLIRNRAKADLLANILKDRPGSEDARAEEQGELVNLRNANFRQVVNGPIEPMEDF